MRAVFSLPTLIATKNVVFGPKFLDVLIPRWPKWANVAIMLLAYNIMVISLPAWILSNFLGIDFSSAFTLSVAALILHLEFRFTPPGFTRIHRPGTQTIVWNGRGRGWSGYSWMDFPEGAYRPAYRFTRAILTQLSTVLNVALMGLIIRIWLDGVTIPGGTSPASLIVEGLDAAFDVLPWMLGTGAIISALRLFIPQRDGL